MIGIGSDLVDIRRIEALSLRFGKKFEERIFTTSEIGYANTKKNRLATLAKRFAAKEAFAKALGTGLGQGAHWQEIAVANTAQGSPQLVISGQTLATLEQMVPPGMQAKTHLSLSDEYPFALGFVVISASGG